MPYGVYDRSDKRSHEEKFHSRYTKNEENGCWEWIDRLDKNGYGLMFYIHTNGKKIQKAHRISYTLHKGDPTGWLVCHHCDNPKCVNPEHLFLGTDMDNRLDSIKKGRARIVKHPSYSAYMQGCRCEDCKAIKRAKHKDYYLRNPDKYQAMIKKNTDKAKQKRLLSLSI